MDRSTGRNRDRLHIDIHADDIEGEAVRLVGLGSQRVDNAPIDEVGSRWIRSRSGRQ